MLQNLLTVKTLNIGTPRPATVVEFREFREFIYFHIPEGYKAHEDITYHTYDGISVETNNKVMNQITLHYALHFVYLSYLNYQLISQACHV